ncbi:DUF2783 domain-containing protein [Pseudaestuariivita sp.]|uniref:DUF2783 domain-containing protein n=1 Tax=Pseudaestuariivita sp. TaxID=2211669 RepID=UPI00405880C4
MLTTTPNLGNPDDFYAALLRAHDGLSADETHALNARLILILANHIGDLTTLEDALVLARGAKIASDATTS